MVSPEFFLQKRHSLVLAASDLFCLGKQITLVSGGVPGDTEVQRRVGVGRSPGREATGTGRNGPWDAAMDDPFILMLRFV